MTTSMGVAHDFGSGGKGGEGHVGHNYFVDMSGRSPCPATPSHYGKTNKALTFGITFGKRFV